MDRRCGVRDGVYERSGWREGPVRCKEEKVAVTEKAEAPTAEMPQCGGLLDSCAARGGHLQAGSLRRDFEARRATT